MGPKGDLISRTVATGTDMWRIEDPAGQSLEMVRVIRDDLRDRVQQLLIELKPSSPAQANVTDG